MDDEKVKFICKYVKSKIIDGDIRFVEEDMHLYKSYWPNNADFKERLFSDYGVGYKDIRVVFEKQYYEEIKLISEALRELDKGKDKDIGKFTELEKSQKEIEKFMKEGGLPSSIWEHIAIPYRTKGDLIFKITPPNDVFGSPIIDVLKAADFIVSISKYSAKAEIDLDILAGRANSFKVATIFTTALSLLLLYNLFYK